MLGFESGSIDSPFADRDSSYHRLYEPAGNIAMYLGNATDPGNYYDNTTHYFRSRLAATNYMIINSSGHVGIGTTSPQGRLSIDEGDLYFNYGNSDAARYVRINKKSSVDGGILLSRDNTLDWQIVNPGSSGDLQVYTYGAATTAFVIKRSDGNVGIGQTNPTARLHIASPNGSDGTLFQRWDYVNNPGVYELQLKQTVTSGVVRYNFSMINANTAYNNVLVLDRGNVGIGTTDPAQKLEVAGGNGSNQVRISYDADTRYYNDIKNQWDGGTVANNQMVFKIATGTLNTTTDVMTLVGNGRVGIGTTSPAQRLDIQGNGVRLRLSTASNPSVYYFDIEQNYDSANTLNFYATNNNNILRWIYDTNALCLQPAGGNVGINTTTPQKSLEVITSVSDFASVGVNTLGVGQWTGIHFGYREASSSYRKSAIVFERTDTTEGNAQGKVHILNGPQSGATSATLSDAKLTIDSYGRVGIGTTSPGYKVDIAGDTRVNGGGVIVRATSPTVYFQDTDHRSAMAHVNSNIFYILRGDGTDSVNWAQYNGYWPLQINLENNNAQFGGEIRTFAGEIVTNLNFVQYNSSYIRTTRDSVYLNSRIGGRITNANPQFINGTVSGWTVYNNSGGSNLTHTIVSEGTINYIPNSTGKALKISYNGSGGTSPGFGGFYFATTNPSSNGAVNNDNQYRQGQRMMVRIMANIPSGRSIEWASNGYGDNGFQQWITAQAGTGDWEEYVMVQQIGKGGSISSTHFFYIAGGSDVAFDWYVAYAESVDLDAPTDIKNSSGLSVGYDTTYNSVAAGYGGIGVSGDIIVNGEVGIGTNTPGYKLHVVGNTYVSGYIQAGGTGYFGGDVIAYYSDKRLKTNIRTIDSVLDKISKIGGYYYTPNELALQLNAALDSKQKMGVLAQEIQEVFPEAIEKAPFDMGPDGKSISGEDYLTVKYDRLVPVLIEAIKEQQKQIEELKYLLTNK